MNVFTVRNFFHIIWIRRVNPDLGVFLTRVNGMKNYFKVTRDLTIPWGSTLEILISYISIF